MSKTAGSVSGPRSASIPGPALEPASATFSEAMTLRPAAASLDDPFYYLHNLSTVLRWVQQQHHSLFTPSELEYFDQFDKLSRAARALLARLVMRTHAEFRLDLLHYPELDQPLAQCVTELAAQGWLEVDPSIEIETLARLLRFKELQAVLSSWDPTALPGRAAPKAQWLAALQGKLGATARPMSEWWCDAEAAPPVISLSSERLAWLRRVRLMFFGNLRQDWSEFVITELGHQRYVEVEFSTAARAFSSRAEVDDYLLLADLAQALEQGASLDDIWAAVPPLSPSLWLTQRRSRLLMELGLQAARTGRNNLALLALEASHHAEARLKALRLREKSDPPGELWSRVSLALEQDWPAGTRSALERIARRAGKRAGMCWQPNAPMSIPERRLRLPRQTGVSVELAVARALAGADSVCRHVENTLFTSLLGLLCWPAIYAPLPGAFFHPFQAGPADLFRSDFVSRREAMLQECLATLESEEYRTIIWGRWEQHYGQTCSLVNWHVLDKALLQAVLACVPAQQLRRILEYLLSDLRHHSRGMPDLIRLWPRQQRFALIEVKGPGDRLQDHQQAWLAYCQTQGIPVEVCYVVWDEGEEGGVHEATGGVHEATGDVHEATGCAGSSS